MAPQIDIAEVLSFRLAVPKSQLERLPDELKSELELAVLPDGDDLLICVGTGDSFLRFQCTDAEAKLTEVAICNDRRGLFFQRVLGTLMIRHGGDLEARLVWNIASRNSDGEHAHVVIEAGRTSYPGLSLAARTLRNALLAVVPPDGLSDLFGHLPPGTPPPKALPASTDGAQPGAPTSRTATGSRPDESDEIDALLERGRQEWDLYLKLKASRAP